MRKYTTPLIEQGLFRTEQKTGVAIPDELSNVFYDVFEDCIKEIFFDVAESGYDITIDLFEALFGVELETRVEYSGNCWNRLFENIGVW